MPKSTLQAHGLTTNDGYHLQIYRLQSAGNPVILWHGMSNSSTMFSNTESNLAIYLQVCGYDVWLANSRGTKHCRVHDRLSDSSLEFWDFSIDEYAEFDCPAVVDYVLAKTMKRKVSYIGFSQGVAMVLAGLSLNEELNLKINLMVGLGPAMRPKQIHNPVVNFIVSMFGSNAIFKMFGRKAFVPIAQFVAEKCPSAVNRFIVQTSMKLLFGWNLKNWGDDIARRDVLVQNVFSTTSVKTLVVNNLEKHWFQMMDHGKFAPYQSSGKTWFEIGPYKSINVISYPVKQITTKAILYTSLDDNLSDIDFITANVPGHFEVRQLTDYEHLVSVFNEDFIWATDAEEKVWRKVVHDLDKSWAIENESEYELWSEGRLSKDSQECKSEARVSQPEFPMDKVEIKTFLRWPSNIFTKVTPGS